MNSISPTNILFIFTIIFGLFVLFGLLKLSGTVEGLRNSYDDDDDYNDRWPNDDNDDDPWRDRNSNDGGISSKFATVFNF